MFKIIKMVFLGVMWMSIVSCHPDNRDALSSISFLIEEMEEEIPTRTGTVYDGTTVTYSWMETDTLGIFPNQGYQVAFPIGSGAGGSYATFNGGGWALKNNASYAAYYPFEYMNKRADRIPLVFTGQLQDGNNLNHIGAYDYLASEPTAPENGQVSFLMKHMACLVLFELTMPKSATYTTISINSDRKVFITSAYLNLQDGSFTMTPNTLSDHVVLNMKNVTLSSGNVLNAYMMVAPTDIGEASYTLSIRDIAGGIYEADMTGKNKLFRMGAKKRITASPVFVSAPGVGTVSTEDDIWGEDLVIEISY
jgi:hypothetical protein